MAFFSWPSKGTYHGYLADAASIEASEPFITNYLVDIAKASEAAKVHIIAHSMGNRGLLRAINRIVQDAAAKTSVQFDQIILAAADVDCDTFRQLSAAYQSVAERTTMYVCDKDKAVGLSEWIHDAARAGFAPPILVVPGVDTVSVSNLDLSLLGHGYYAEARDLLQDIHRLINSGAAPQNRFGLQAAVTEDGLPYWIIAR